MESSAFILRTLGVIYLTIGLGLFIFREPYVYVLRKILDNPGCMILGGFMAVVTGMAIVSYHNLWTNDWRVMVTIIGWISLTKGIAVLLIPVYSGYLGKAFPVRKGKGLTIILVSLGLIFCYFGYFGQ